MGEKPFTKATVLDKRDYCIILAFAENNMRLPETAYSMGVHRNTVEYRLKKICRITGRDPRNFYDLIELLRMVKGT